jgi:hypothetical protein
MTSGAEFKGEINASQLDLNLTSGARTILKGQVKNSDLTVNTGAILEMKRLLSENAKINAHTGGQVEVMVNESVDLFVITGARIDYYGDPKIIGRKSKLGGKICHKSHSE